MTSVKAAAAALCVVGGLAGPAMAVEPSPYDVTYELREAADTPLYADMSEKAAAVGTLPSGARGIVLRWCRKEIPFGAWQFGSRKEQLKLLDERWCEVAYDGKVGNVPGRVLAPE